MHSRIPAQQNTQYRAHTRLSHKYLPNKIHCIVHCPTKHSTYPTKNRADYLPSQVFRVWKVGSDLTINAKWSVDWNQKQVAGSNPSLSSSHFPSHWVVDSVFILGAR